ncbi:putative ABC transport system permease protein [Faecalicoccus acidiformans]|uniref:Putative ABC transport system permease protein n=1 Tax=Faecalicoccus acidiformans TaxID=915173 RepID=A0A7W8FYN8_9FIRM|nr:FtsX-like permease family protein [Faecalicoccus acidiformans]MBB5185005.1 putative ABC transport system permease protein [Faecalicoccus acidiformans]
MPKTFLKNIFCEIKSSFGRFFSILSIVAIGVAFFAGVKASAPDMKYSADAYFDKQNLQDIQVYSTLGLTDEDIQAIQEVEGVESAQGLFTMDVLTQKENTQLVLKLISLPEDQEINTIRLIEGRMPENDHECLVEADSATNTLFGGLEIGETITLSSGTDTPIGDSLANDTYTIVGTCYTPTYLSYQKGSSSIGSGTLNTFIYVPEQNILSDYYTEVDVLVDGAKVYNSYEEDYFDVIDPVVKEIEKIAGDQIEVRIIESQQELDEAKAEFNAQIQDAQNQIDWAQNEINQGQQTIQNSEATLASSRAQLDAGWQEYYNNLALLDNLPVLNDAIAQIETAEASLPQVESGIQQAQAGLNTINQTLANLESSYQQITAITDLATLQTQAQTIQDQIALLDPNDPANTDIIAGLQTQLSQIEQSIELIQGYESLVSQRSQVQAQYDQLVQTRDQINASVAQKATLISQRDALLNAQVQLQQAYNELVNGEAQYTSGLAQIQSAKEELASGQSELNASVQDLEAQKAKGQQQLEDSQNQIDELEGEWIVLDRNSHYSYRDYGACADRMDGIAAVFPVFFFMVAALVCMTTMTRMVDEQRTEIGTLKALGYSKLQIASKYLIYALIASLIGSAIGCLVGMTLFPTVIFTAWNMLYNLETIHFEFQPGLILLASGSVTGITLLATIYSIYSELMEVPSQLMRPKSSKAGKKILLERIKPLWSRLSFLHKVTARNIFRYKKRFFMTIIGIAGCSALLVSGFGINDSIGDIAAQQYGNIYLYNATVGTEDDSNAELSKQIEDLKGVQEASKERQTNMIADYEDEDHTVTAHIVDDPSVFSDFTSLKTEKGESLELDDSGVIISQKLANKMQLEKGDTFTLEDSDEQPVEMKVAGIFENYVGHHIYMTENYFETLDTDIDPNSIYMIKTEDQSEDFEDQLGKQLMELDTVNSVTFYSSLQKNFTDMISSISFIVVVLVISAALLAFVVLYNLSNVNISERVREIATIKVLGFTRREVNQYVNREGILLAMMGAVLGLVIGIGLHHLIMNLAEMDDVMFGRTILPQSYFYSFALTMLFTFIINFFMSFKLKKIQMVESLKAVE